MSAPSICFVIPYFGHWPFWMPFYLRSCAFNADIDWVFYTDCGIPPDAPDNVRFIEIAFADYCALVSSRLDIDFCPQSPYKLCDIKPALGLIHQDDLRGYDYWGFGDVDVIYGDLRRYLSTERLQSFSLVSTHARRVSGHLCVMRNDEQWRGAFKQVGGWREQFQSSEHQAFDERAFSKLFIRHKNWPQWLRSLFDRFNPWRTQADFTEQFSTPEGSVAWRDGGFSFPSWWLWHEGRLGCDKDDFDYPYLHFIYWKSTDWKNRPLDDVMQVTPYESVWYISSAGFRSLPS